jgi:hypothetical protein
MIPVPAGPPSGGEAAANAAALFDDQDVEALPGQGRCAGAAGQAGSDDGDVCADGTLLATPTVPNDIAPGVNPA